MKARTLYIGCILCISPLSVFAEENGSGAYVPGSIASHIDSMLPAPGWIARVNYFNFSGTNEIDCVTLACNNRANIDANLNAVSLTLGWRPDWVIHPDISYMTSIVVPYLFLDIRSEIIPIGAGGSFTLRDSNDGVGDIELIPLNVSYHLNKKHDLNFKFIVRAPTGEFDANELANLGKNFWAIEPTISWLYHDYESSVYADVYAGLNINETNPDTDFKSGQQFHTDFTLQKKFIHEGQQIGVGITGYTYHQIQDDGGSSAIFRGNRARSAGIGPVLSYTGQLFGKLAVSEFKWIHDVNTVNRFTGDTIILKAGLIF